MKGVGPYGGTNFSFLWSYLTTFHRSAMQADKLTLHKYICTYLLSFSCTHTHTHANTRVHKYLTVGVRHAVLMLIQEPLWKVSGWLLSDVRLICNSSPFCSDKWVGVFSFQEDSWSREGEERRKNNTMLIMFFWHMVYMTAGMTKCCWQVFQQFDIWQVLVRLPTPYVCLFSSVISVMSLFLSAAQAFPSLVVSALRAYLRHAWGMPEG